MRADDGSSAEEGPSAVREAASSESGVYRGWYVVAGGFVGAFVVFGLSYAFGVFLEPIQRDLGLSRSGVSVIFSLQTVVIYVAAALLGVLADRFGVRRLLSAGAVVLAIGGVWTSRANGYAGLLVAYGVCTAIGLGAIYVVSYATVPRWFDRRRGLATGIATAGLGIGMVATAPAASALVAAIGWRVAILALVLAAAAAVAAVAPLFADDPASSDAPVDVEREFPDGVANREPPDWATYRRELSAVALSRPFLLLFAGWVLTYATLYVVLVHVVAYASDAGLGDGTGAIAIAVVGATTAIARIGIGGLADRLGRVRTFVACSAVMGLSTLGLPFAGSAVGLYAVAVVFGVAYGGNGALLSPLTVDLFGSANPNAIFGLVSLSFAVSGLLAPWIAGLAYDLAGTYTPAFVGAGLAGLVGSALIAAAAADA
ncbi:MFS transporter [Haloterrigena salinisoli]|uniref:MFS transporter n=1 Tax=Haloterrigena salinisoli TaxID=3132747 RepID=UPI0030CFC965